MDTPFRVYSKTSYFFPPQSFKSDHSDFFTPHAQLPIEQHFFSFYSAPLHKFSVKIEPLPSLNLTPVLEMSLNRPITILVLAPPPQQLIKLLVSVF